MTRELDTSKQLSFSAAIFDLDGVVTSTNEHHFTAWKRMFEEDLGIGKFTRDDYTDYVSGKPRLDGIRSLIHLKGIELNERSVFEYGERKQVYYLDLLEEKGAQVFEESVRLVDELRDKGVLLAIGSSSKNSPFVLDKTGLRDRFSVVVANDTVYNREGERRVSGIKGKPEPDIFLTACKVLGVNPDKAIGFEDAESGVKAFRRGGIVAVGVDRDGIADKLWAAGANLVVNDLDECPPEVLERVYIESQLRATT